MPLNPYISDLIVEQRDVRIISFATPNLQIKNISFFRSMNYLDFEKPLDELNDQLVKARQIAEKGKVDVTSLIAEIEKKIDDTRKNIYSNLTAWQKVQLSRHPDRPYALDYIRSITNNTFMEFFGDRSVKDDKAMIGGFGAIDGKTIMFIGQQKGNNT